AFQRRHADARVEIRCELDRRVAVVQPFMEIVIARHVECRALPPVDFTGVRGETRANRMADEQVVDRQRAAHAEQRTAPEAVKIERRAGRIADCPAGQSVVDAATAIEMGEEGHRVAEKPRARTGNRGEDGKAVHWKHLTKYASGSP